MGQNLVASAKNPGIKVFQAEDGGLATDVDLDTVRETAARLLACGFNPKKVSNSLKSYLSPTGSERSAYIKLRRWMQKDQKFRDLIFQQAVIRMDLQTPTIMQGIVAAATRGRVDAARLALEVTGRHTSHEAPVTNVTVQIANIPRPNAE